jgi:hypothetical protein
MGENEGLSNPLSCWKARFALDAGNPRLCLRDVTLRLHRETGIFDKAEYPPILLARLRELNLQIKSRGGPI